MCKGGADCVPFSDEGADTGLIGRLVAIERSLWVFGEFADYLDFPRLVEVVLWTWAALFGTVSTL